jgi:sortase (surface protein transpeptidase)
VTTTTDVVPSRTTVVAPAVRSGANVNQVDAVGEPVGLTIPSIGVDTPLTPVGVLDDGTVAVPPDPSIAGWFTGGPRPGELGPAVIMGHVDSKKSGPGVFWRLGDLDVGDEAVVHTTSGDVRFVVTEREQVAKDSFPADRVYGPVPERALRLITCGGSFDRTIGHYRDNIVVYLVEAAP